MHDFTFTMPAGIRYGIGMHEQLGTMLKDEMQFQKVFILTGRLPPPQEEEERKVQRE